MSSKKTLIIPDVHNRISLVEKIIESVKPNKTIFLGDYFDNFFDNAEIARNTAEWFKSSINQKDRIHLVGNHDIHYWFSENPNVRCSGYEYGKSVVINDIVTTNDWEKLKFFHILDRKFLLSHAGIHPSFINDKTKSGQISDNISLKKLKSKLEKDSKSAIKELYNGEQHWFTGAGYSRGGSQKYGGITWCDWNREFHPIRGIHQIVGHTPNYEINWYINDGIESWMTKHTLNSRDCVKKDELTNKNSYNICLDTHPGSKHYAIYENGLLKIHNVPDIK